MADLEKIKLSQTTDQWTTNLNKNFTELENSKVDKVEGKQLSTNDFTDSEKNKLANIASGAEVNKIDSIEVNGIEATITDKKASVTIPLAGKTSDLTNDSFVSYTTAEQGLTDEQKQNARTNIDAEKSFTKNTAFNKNFEDSTDNIKMNGEVSVGTSTTVARADHVHPSDTSKLDAIKANRNVTQDLTVKTTDGSDNVSLEVSYINLSSQAQTSESKAISLANDQHAGLMSKSDYSQIRQNTEDIARLKNVNVRLLYTDKSDPIATEIDTFVQSKGYTSPYQGISVVVDATKHVWHYYEGGTGWKDDGSESIANFTNTTAGTILGSSDDGKIHAETDGTGSVNGWDDLKNRVSTVESGKVNKTDVQNETGTSTSNPISQNAATTAINAVKTDLNGHINNKENPHEVTKEQVGLGNVDNTSDANKPVSTAQQTALDNKLNKNLTAAAANKNVVTDASGNITTEDKPVILNVSTLTFTDAADTWSANTSDGTYTLTLASTKTPISNARKLIADSGKYQDIMATVEYDSQNIYITSDEKFSGAIAVV